MSPSPPTFDLQSHSTYSDGELPPAGVVAAAAQAGIELLALTDHDSVEGTREAAGAAARAGIGLVNAVEISALDPASSDIHILGYLIDTANAALRAALEASRADREARSTRMGDALKDLGFELDEGLLRARAAAGRTMGAHTSPRPPSAIPPTPRGFETRGSTTRPPFSSPT